jgi:hypothetical protein
MALKAKIANKSVTSENGFILGTITDILETEERTEISRNGSEVKYSAQYEVIITAPGTRKDINYHVWVGQLISNVERDYEGVKSFNSLTTLLLNLGLLDKVTLLKDDSVYDNFDLEQLLGLKIEFELEPSKKVGLSKPKLSSIKQASLEPAKTVKK